jgi:hypothetical protein
MAESSAWRTNALNGVLILALISTAIAGRSLFTAFWYEFDEPMEWRQLVDAAQLLGSFAVALAVSKVQQRAEGDPQHGSDLDKGGPSSARDGAAADEVRS